MQSDDNEWQPEGQELLPDELEGEVSQRGHDVEVDSRSPRAGPSGEDTSGASQGSDQLFLKKVMAEVTKLMEERYPRFEGEARGARSPVESLLGPGRGSPRPGSQSKGSEVSRSSCTGLDSRPALGMADAMSIQSFERGKKFEGRSYIEYRTFIRKFDRQVGSTPIPASHKLDHLIDSCSLGIQNLLYGAVVSDGEEGYKKARDILDERFGQKDLYVLEVVTDLAKGPVIKSKDGRALKELADRYFKAIQVATAAEMQAQLAFEYVTIEIANRMPST